MALIKIEYQIQLPTGKREIFVVSFDEETFEQPLPSEALPDWTRLEYKQCEHCPLKPKEKAHCPLAAHLPRLIEVGNHLISHDKITAVIHTPRRSFEIRESAQQILSTLMGLVSATSGCPHTTFLKPMAYFHLPNANVTETVYRATSMYLLAQYFKKKEGLDPDWELEQLKDHYIRLHGVNKGMSERLTSVVEGDASLNAIVVLDVFALLLPHSVEESLESTRFLFRNYLKAAGSPRTD